MAIIHVIGSSIFFYVLLLITPVTLSVSESEALLNLKKSFANATSLDSWMPGTEPCGKNTHWVGVLCVNGVVTSIRLRNMGLSGKIDVDALLSLSGLRSIGFVLNSFSGPIPDFNRMVLLKGLYLARNQFSGEIPEDYFRTMAGLKKVWLSGNRFSGRVPGSLLQLSHLIELRLEDNQFSGTIPPVLKHSSLVVFNVSNNNLEGDIPPGLSKFGPGSFVGNPGLCGGNLSRTCDDSSNGAVSPATTRHVATSILLAAALLFFVMVVGIYVLKRRQERSGDSVDESPSFTISSVRKTEFVATQGGLGLGQRTGSSRKGGSRKFGKGVDIVMVNDEKGEFTLSDLMKAAAEVLGNGLLASTYKAVMVSGLTVVVKRIKEVTKITKDEFDGEMRRLGSLRHKNVLTPLAYHYRKDEKLLVSSYQPKGSLHFLLHGDQGMSRSDLNWPARLKIILGIARGLALLHTELSSFDLPHGNLKSTNVLLDEKNEPLLTDYGLCSLISSSKAAQTLTAYKSPEAILDQNISPKCDIYFLGIIILEILTGKLPSQYQSNGECGVDIVQWVRSAVGEGREGDLFDPEIERTASSVSEMEQILLIGAACTDSNPGQRLDIIEVVRRIEGIAGEDHFLDMETIHLQMSSEDESDEPFREMP